MKSLKNRVNLYKNRIDELAAENEKGKSMVKVAENLKKVNDKLVKDLSEFRTDMNQFKNR